MLIPFEDLNNSARIWIYTANRKLTSAEIAEIEIAGKSFVNEWTAHQQTLHASFKIFHSLFLILAVDENVNDASGCSIDKSVHFIKQIEQRYQLNLFDRLLVSYKEANEISVKSIKEFVPFYIDHYNNKDIKVFNNLISRKGEIDTAWLIPVNESWVNTRIESSIK